MRKKVNPGHLPYPNLSLTKTSAVWVFLPCKYITWMSASPAIIWKSTSPAELCDMIEYISPRWVCHLQNQNEQAISMNHWYTNETASAYYVNQKNKFCLLCYFIVSVMQKTNLEYSEAYPTSPEQWIQNRLFVKRIHVFNHMQRCHSICKCKIV